MNNLFLRYKYKTFNNICFEFIAGTEFYELYSSDNYGEFELNSMNFIEMITMVNLKRKL